MSPEEFVMLQLAGEVQPFEGISEKEPKWWTEHWNADGNYLCTCGSKDKEPKTL